MGGRTPFQQFKRSLVSVALIVAAGVDVALSSEMHSRMSKDLLYVAAALFFVAFAIRVAVDIRDDWREIREHWNAMREQ